MIGKSGLEAVKRTPTQKRAVRALAGRDRHMTAREPNAHQAGFLDSANLF